MGSRGDKATEGIRSDRTSPASDAEVTAALLELFCELELGEQFRVLLGRGLSWSGADVGFVFGESEDGKRLVPLVGSIPEDDPRYRALHRLKGAQAVGWVEGDCQRFDGLGPLEAVASKWRGDPVLQSLAFPLRGDAEPVGVVWLMFAGEPRPGGAERFGNLVQLGRPALANAIQVRRMRDLIIRDDTAACFNRRYFEEFLPEELSRASRFRAPLSLIFFDLDNLKRINNEHGHAMGSQALRELALRVRGRIRKFDKLFRFGGDEFCIVLPETEWHGALEVGERVREAIAKRPFLTEGTGIADGVRITASFGIASFPLHARTKEQLIRQSDRAMQQVKNFSKNAVGVAEIVEDEHGG